VELQKMMTKRQRQLEDADSEEVFELIDDIQKLSDEMKELKGSTKRLKLIKIAAKDGVAEVILNSLKKL